MQTTTVTRAEEYYQLVGEKNAEEVKKFLHSDVEFYSPLATIKGKDAVFESTCKFMNTFTSLKIRATFAGQDLAMQDQAMIVYDVVVPGLAKKVSGASMLRFQDGLIVRIELFFDASAFR